MTDTYLVTGGAGFIDICDRAAMAAVLDEYRPIAVLNSLGKEGMVE